MVTGTAAIGLCFMDLMVEGNGVDMGIGRCIFWGRQRHPAGKQHCIGLVPFESRHLFDDVYFLLLCLIVAPGAVDRTALFRSLDNLPVAIDAI